MKRSTVWKSVFVFCAVVWASIFGSVAYAHTTNLPVIDSEKVVLSSNGQEIYFSARGFGSSLWHKTRHQGATLSEDNGNEFTQDAYATEQSETFPRGSILVINHWENGEYEFLINKNGVVLFDTIMKKVGGTMVYVREGN